MRGKLRIVLAVCFVAYQGMPALAQPPEPIAYTISFPEPQSHYIEVEAVIPTAGRPTVELMMAVWAPGSYLVREFAGNLEKISARTPKGTPLSIASSRKNRWQIDAGGSPTIVLTYRVYSREMSVRTNWVDDRFALVNGAPTFLTIADDTAESRPHDVLVQLPPDWAQSVTSLRAAPDGRPNSYRADDFDELVDSPIVAGNPAVYEFEVAGVPHSLVNIGEGRLWEGQAAADDVQRIVREQHELWGFFPYERYLFLNLIIEAGGGIEHKASTVLMTSRWQMRDHTKYLDWLTLVSHELFHAWNVKRLRPVELGPFDYESEVHTRSLWVAEGLTVYYGALLVHRAGLSTRDEYLSSLSSQIRDLQTTPGRLVQSVEQASYDAWTKHYRRNENSSNTTVSYYTKGAVIGFLLDARIRRTTGGARTLDDVLRLAYERYSGQRGFTPADFRKTVEDGAATEVDFDPWLVEVLETSTELDYTEALDWFGLALVQPESAAPDESSDNDAAPVPGWLGLEASARGDNIVVTSVARDTPGYAAGFNVNDEILAIDAYRVRAGDWKSRLGLYRPGQEASVLVSRRGELRRLPVTFGTPPEHSWHLDPRTVQTPAQTYRVDAWLGAVQ